MNFVVEMWFMTVSNTSDNVCEMLNSSRLDG